MSLWPLPLASALEKSYRQHIYYIIWGSNLKFRVWMHLDVVDCSVLFLATLTLTFTEHISYIIWHRTAEFGMWIHLLATVCQLLFSVTETLTSGFSRARSISVFRFKKESELWCVDTFWGWRSVTYCFRVILILTGLGFRKNQEKDMSSVVKCLAC